MGLIKVLNTWWGIMVEACKYKNYAFQDPDLGLCNRVLFLHNLVGGRGKYLSKIFYCSKWIRNQYWMSSLHNRLVFYFCFCSSIRSLTDTDYYSHYHIWARPWFWALNLDSGSHPSRPTLDNMTCKDNCVRDDSDLLRLRKAPCFRKHQSLMTNNFRVKQDKKMKIYMQVHICFVIYFIFIEYVLNIFFHIIGILLHSIYS